MRFNSLSLILAMSQVLHQAEARPRPCNNSKAVYIISNEAENAVVALRFGADGMISDGTSTATGGAGGRSVDGTGEPAAVDPLLSQSALTLAGNSLFAVNAGSNTLTMFKINKADPAKLTMVGQPVAIPGEFPNTVAASDMHGLVCVGTTGAAAGVSCASFSQRGIGAMDNLRSFDLGQTTPPSGPPNTVSHVFFSDDQNTLYTTVKGNPGMNNTGFLAAFPVQAAECGGEGDVVTVSHEGTRSSPEGTLVLFGSTPILGSTDIFVTDASFGGAVLSTGSDGQTAGLVARGPVEGQVATCWATFSPATDTVFVTDVGMNRLVEMSTTDASIVDIIDLGANGESGLLDLGAFGDFVYALSPGNGTSQAAIMVVNAVTKQFVQQFELGELGARRSSTGLAIYP